MAKARWPHNERRVFGLARINAQGRGTKNAEISCFAIFLQSAMGRLVAAANGGGQNRRKVKGQNHEELIRRVMILPS
jgi:hypothetical protein